MIENNNNTDQDLLMRSILEGGQEEVPAHVWEGVSAGLDKAARRRKAALWWRRAAAGGAVAAAVAAVLLLNPGGSGEDIVPIDEGGGLIAVVEPADTSDSVNPEEVLIAQAEPVVRPASAGRRAENAAEAVAELTETGPEETESVEQAEVVEQAGRSEDAETINVAEKTAEEPASEKTYFPEDWGEDEEKAAKVKTSLTLSGLTGTNSAQNSARRNLIKRPSISKAPAKTGVKETSTNSTYGIPLSFGAGVKLEFTPKWSLGAGISYSLLSRKFYGEYQKVNASGIIENSTSSDITNTQHYIGIPVNAFYNIVDSKNVNFYAYAGGAVEKCISDSYALANTTITHKESPSGVQWSANIGIGAEFMIGNHLGLYIDPSLRYYFDNGQPKSIRTAQPFMLGFEMGLRVRL